MPEELPTPEPALGSTVLVTGDIVRDAHLYGGVKTSPVSSKEPGTSKSIAPGGAALTENLLRAVGQDSGWNTLLGIDIGRTEEEKEAFIDRLPTSLHSFGVWTPHPMTENDKTKVWRVTTNFGYGPTSGDDAADCLEKRVSPENSPALILIDDGGIAFRHERCRNVWPEFGLAEDGPLVVLKLSTPLCHGDLFPKLIDIVADRLIVIIRAEDLRRENGLIRRRLSWEQTVTDTLLALEDTRFADLRSAAHLVVSFGSAGALWITREGQSHLVFDPNKLEGDFHSRFDGRVYGFQTCLSVAIAHHLLVSAGGGSLSVTEKSLSSGLAAGLAAKRELVRLGHGEVGIDVPGFPTAKIAECIVDPPSGYFCISVPTVAELKADSSWTILARTEHPQDPGSTEPAIGLAQLAARFGLDALSDIPSYSAGDLFSVDRREIESLRTLEYLILNYENGGRQKKPLSIGVFGPPGAGKSFGVNALSEAILGDDVPILEFNLSQFKGPEELTGAFHRVRDEVLRGKTPVAFWDEFDSQKFKWLQYLLAPMQDGTFQDGQITHPIGKCIFVFAGGTSSSFNGFAREAPATMDSAKYLALSDPERALHDRKVAAYEEFKLLKGPDFASRLHGHLNVLGPNPSEGEPDFTWAIRRALMMRGLLKLKRDVELKIDTELLRALLSVKKYTHGARSFQKIIDSLNADSRHGHLIPSALLPLSLLEQETDADDFMAKLGRNKNFLDHAQIEEIAETIHNRYYNEAKARGWGIRDALDTLYAGLSPSYKESNRAAARRIPEHLSLIDFQVVPSDDPADLSWVGPLSAQIRTHLDRLAKAEHIGWSAERTANGWTKGERDEDRKHHPALVPWSQLSPSDKDKDRENIHLIPEVLKLAGFKAVGLNVRCTSEDGKSE